MDKSTNEGCRKKQSKKVSYDFKLRILDQISNGQISINHASKKYNVSRSSISYWMQKMLSFEQKQRFMSSKDEIKKLRERIEELEFIKSLQQELMAEAELENGVDFTKKSLPDTLAKEVAKKKQELLKQGFTTNVSGSANKGSTSK